MDDLELPVATSDMEADSTDREGAFTPADDTQMFSEDEITTGFSQTAMADFFGLQPGSDQPTLSDDFFDQFTNINAQSSDSTQPSSDQTITNGGINPFEDFFWGTLNPLAEGNMVHANPMGDSGTDDYQSIFDFGDMKMGGMGGELPILPVNTGGFAKDVSALFSGCVV
jgi:hypothetical protein